MRSIKVLFFILGFVLGFAALSQAADFTGTETGAGTGTYWGRVNTYHTGSCSFVDADASITVLEITLEGRKRNGSWHQMGTEHTFTAGELSAKKAKFTYNGDSWEETRFNIITITGGNGTTDIVSCDYIGR